MTDTHIDTISICVDCAYASSNGFDTEFPEGFTESYVANANELGAEPSVICGDNEYLCGYFSWRPCEFCGSPLGGDRHTAVLVYKG